MLKKFQWFGDARNILQLRTRDLPEKQATNSSSVSWQHRKIPARTTKSKKRFSRSFLRCKPARPRAHRECGARDVGFGSSASTFPDHHTSGRLNFKGWFQGLCICGRRRRGCNKTFAAWRYFRKDCKGSVPVVVETFSDFHLEERSQFKFLADISSDYSYESAYQPPMSNVCDRVYDPRIGSLETGGTCEDFNELRGNPWCKILYWEGRERKGNEFPVQNSSINVMGETPHGNGLSLAALFGGVNDDDRIMKTRKKICQGLVLWREEEVIWIYNRSEAPVYLNSASLDGSFYHLNLYKCPPGYAMIIYYYEMARHLMGHPEYNNRALDKADVNSVRISFAKGWGKNYQRREILCCPCWIEVHVVPTLRVEQLTPPR